MTPKKAEAPAFAAPGLPSRNICGDISMKKRTPVESEVKPADEWTDGLLWALAERISKRIELTRSAAAKPPSAPPIADNVIRFPVERRCTA